LVAQQTYTLSPFYTAKITSARGELHRRRHGQPSNDLTDPRTSEKWRESYGILFFLPSRAVDALMAFLSSLLVFNYAYDYLGQ